MLFYFMASATVFTLFGLIVFRGDAKIPEGDSEHRVALAIVSEAPELRRFIDQPFRFSQYRFLLEQYTRITLHRGNRN